MCKYLYANDIYFFIMITLNLIKKETPDIERIMLRNQFIVIVCYQLYARNNFQYLLFY